MTKKVKVPMIKNEAIVTIKMSGAFYSALQQTLTYLTSQVEQSEINAFIEKINNESKDLNDWEMAVETLMVLCAEVEAKAKEQNLITEEEVEVPSTPEDSQSEDQSAS